MDHAPTLVTIRVDGRAVECDADATVASAMIASGETIFSRSAKYHRPRGAFCFSGHCGACLVRVDGEPNVRACRTPAREGLTVQRQNAFPSVNNDLLGAADLAFPGGMNHHTMFVRPRIVNTIMQKAARQIAGLGELPDVVMSEHDAAPPRTQTRHVDVVVVGAGPAGLACATAIARAKKTASVLLLDEQDRPGGSYWTDPRFGREVAERAAREAKDAGVEIVSDATALGWYDEDRAPGASTDGLLAVATPTGLLRVTANRYVYATGGYEQNAEVEGNDRPGVYAARGLGRLLVRHDLAPTRRTAVVGDGALATALVAALESRGVEVRHLDGTNKRITAVIGGRRVRAVRYSDHRKNLSSFSCDTVAICEMPAPASDLPRQHGVTVTFDAARGGFCCNASDDGKTAREHVFVAGDVAGYLGPDDARKMGERIGAAIVLAKDPAR